VSESKFPRFMRLPEVMAVTGLKHTRIRELEKKGKFPKRVVIGDRANGWVESEILQWMTDRMAKRETKSESAAA
jgi:prophage regulatory protein